MTYKRKEIIGDAVLYLGDCRDIIPFIGAIDCIVSDPPYGMKFQSNYREISHRAIDNDDTEELLHWACDMPVDHSKYLFCRWDNLVGIKQKPKSLVTWVKNNHSMGDLLHEHGRMTEVALFFPGGGHDFPIKRPNDVVYAQTTGNNFHPTEKPVSLMEQVISWTRGVVVDPFMGSGTTGVACAKMGRKFVGVELDESYFEIACRRIEEASSQRSMFESDSEFLSSTQVSFI